jgi:NAD/NADP transhydrogenase alpha subunit
MRTTAARTLSPVLALIAALALVAVAILTGALTTAGHDSAGASWNKKDQAGASWNKTHDLAGASWNKVGGGH